MKFLSLMSSLSMLALLIQQAMLAHTKDKAYLAWLAVARAAFEVVAPFVKNQAAVGTFEDYRADFDAAFAAIAERRGWK